jgi:hypothetical protein
VSQPGHQSNYLLPLGSDQSKAEWLLAVFATTRTIPGQDFPRGWPIPGDFEPKSGYEVELLEAEVIVSQIRLWRQAEAEGRAKAHNDALMNVWTEKELPKAVIRQRAESMFVFLSELNLEDAPYSVKTLVDDCIRRMPGEISSYLREGEQAPTPLTGPEYRAMKLGEARAEVVRLTKLWQDELKALPVAKERLAELRTWLEETPDESPD